MRVWGMDRSTPQSIEKHTLSALVGFLSASRLSANQKYLVSRVVYGGEVEHVFEPGYTQDEPVYRCFHAAPGCDGTLRSTSDTLCYPTITTPDRIYGRTFEAKGKNLLCLTGKICYHLLSLHFTGTIERSLLVFTSQSEDVLRLVRLGQEALFDCGPYSGNMYELVRFIPAVTLLCVAYDAHVGYEDMLDSMCSYSFAQRADVVRRLLGIIHTLEALLQRRSPLTMGSEQAWVFPVAGRMIRLSDNRLFFRYGSTGVCVIHSVSTDHTDYLAAGMRLQLYALDKLYLANTLDGSVNEVTTTVPLSAGMAYVADLCHAILRVEDTVDDGSFVALYALDTKKEERTRLR